MTLQEKLQVALDDHGGAEYTLDDVIEAVKTGQAQWWEKGDAVLVTEIVENRAGRLVHFWLAAGDLEEVIQLSEEVLEWARGQGCTRATLSGRKGWARALSNRGWSHEAVLMGRHI